MNYLTIEEIIAMNYALIKRYSPREMIGVKDKSALEMTIAQPKQNVFDKELYPTVYDKAYILYFNLIKKHCFHNANKRTAVLALLVFLKRNGIELIVDKEELEEMTVAIAIDVVSKDEISAWIQSYAKKVT
ncbi:type II toxin-antitoxin system death-on-curing family toxin [Pisciglobus halotolerans]|uniref:Death on curing protein n=1 Tax=Pisciglobus halotolerans TaxID=745365 RepID=A0A1I3AYE0_9LACT|nr:type II toxin-antitoxin system death-on-curing family toxin [Pisciglobus halotolerans]SFH54826.1 death on curing protein [Pisciglobus halotolerans]